MNLPPRFAFLRRSRATRRLLALVLAIVCGELVYGLRLRKPCDDDEGHRGELYTCSLFLRLDGRVCRTASRKICAHDVPLAEMYATRELEWSFPPGSTPYDAVCDLDILHPHITPLCPLPDGGSR